SGDRQGRRVQRVRRLMSAAAAVALAVTVSAAAQPPVAQPVPAGHGADEHFAQVEHAYVTYVLAQYPVVATYLGGSAYDPSLAGGGGALRDLSAPAPRRGGDPTAAFGTGF